MVPYKISGKYGHLLMVLLGGSAILDRMDTRLLQDILRQPAELDGLLGRAGPAVDRAASALRDARDVYLAGIGASWAAAVAGLPFFLRAGRPACLADASELMHQASFRPGSAVLALSRSGKSVEMVRVADLAASRDLRLVAVTNGPDSPLAARADEAVLLEVGFDHGVSVVAYSAIALAGGLVAAAAAGTLDRAELDLLRDAIRVLPETISAWRVQIRSAEWFATEAPKYFRSEEGRGGKEWPCK
jgi:glucosamine--fructose-6-phosphate aminotransferase (isomerizing)